MTGTYANEISYEKVISGYMRISASEAKEMMQKGGVIVIDVRTPQEYASGHIANALNIPLESIIPGRALAGIAERDKPLLIYCRSGVRADHAARMLVESGYQSVYNFGGILSWPFGLVTP